MLKIIIELFIIIFLTGCFFLLNKKNNVYILCAMLPFAYFHTRFGPITIFIIFSAFIANALRSMERGTYEEKFKLRLVIKLIFLTILFIYFSSFVLNFNKLSQDGVFTSSHAVSIYTLLSCMALFYLIVKEMKNDRDVHILIKILIAAYFISSIVSVMQIVLPNTSVLLSYLGEAKLTSSRGVRVCGTFAEYELYAELSGIIMIFLLYYFFEDTGTIKRLFLAALIGAVFFFLMMSKTRGGIVALAISLVYLFIIHGPKLFLRIGMVKLWIFAFLFVIALGSGYFITISTQKYDLVSETLNTQIDIKKGNFDTRSGVWEYGVREIKKVDNVLLGKGPGLTSGTKLLDVYPHCLYLYLYLSLGLSGLVSYCLLFVYLFLGNPGYSIKEFPLPAYTKTIMVLFIIDEFKIEFIRNVQYQHVIWMVWAIVYLVHFKIKPPVKKDHAPLHV